MNVRGMSGRYEVRTLTVQDIDVIYELSVGNPLFYQYCLPHGYEQTKVKYRWHGDDCEVLSYGKTATEKRLRGTSGIR
ncbi:MAG: hypothetical protein HUJ58_10470 [Erysipelotrichaceae bacterium]|nr:hypothetical protein [Erysipelotrichaceae bacterium]